MKKLLLFICLSLILFSCKKDDIKPKSQANFVIESQNWWVTSYNSPALKIKIKNTGELSGYNLDVEVKAMQGNTIIEVAHAYPGNLLDINGGQSATDDAIFFNISPSESSQYTYVTSMTWLNR